MAEYEFLISRMLTAKIKITADSIKEAKALCEDEAERMRNSDYTDWGEHSLELTAAPTEKELFEGQGITIW